MFAGVRGHGRVAGCGLEGPAPPPGQEEDDPRHQLQLPGTSSGARLMEEEMFKDEVTNSF